MTTRELFRLLGGAARVMQAECSDRDCPDAGWTDRFPEALSPEELEHIAFCNHCRRLLQIRHTGAECIDAHREPKWNRLLARITRRARWEHLKEMIAGWIDALPARMPLPAVAATRLAGEVPITLKMVIFEINLGKDDLAKNNLTIEHCSLVPDFGSSRLVLSGFYRSLAGCEVRFGLCPRETILSVCRQDPPPIPPDLARIERMLRTMFTGKSQRSRAALRRIGAQSIWIGGTIESDDSPVSRLQLKLSEHPADLFVRGELWAILVVGLPLTEP